MILGHLVNLYIGIYKDLFPPNYNVGNSNLILLDGVKLCADFEKLQF